MQFDSLFSRNPPDEGSLLSEKMKRGQRRSSKFFLRSSEVILRKILAGMNGCYPSSLPNPLIGKKEVHLMILQ